MRTLFFYGTLRDRAVLATVLGPSGTPEQLQEATLADHAVMQVAGGDWPVIVAREGASAQGLLARELGAEQVRRLDYYEGPFDYALKVIEVVAPGGSCAAEVYFPAPSVRASERSWSLEDWQASHGPVTRDAAIEFMAHVDRLTSDQAHALYPAIRRRAESRRARRTEAGPNRPGTPTAADLRLVEHIRPFSGHFALSTFTIDHPRFDGGREVVAREVFETGEAVTVLPYDPIADRVLLVEQFRAGAYLAGDPQPWTLEPVAGHRDRAESPEETAHREAAEEAGITLDRLERIAGYYPSPGAYSEFLHSYVGLADLSGAGGNHGVAAEQEDIRVHVLDWAAADGMLADGSARNGPLVTSLLWLRANRDRLRGPIA